MSARDERPDRRDPGTPDDDARRDGGRHDGGLPDDALPDETLDALREAFGALPAPPSARALADEDETTRRAVAWMASAWRALPAPAPRAPGKPEQAAPRTAPGAPPSLAAARARRAARWRRPAAAAALLIASLGLAWLLSGRTRAVPAAPPVAGAPGGDAAPGDRGAYTPVKHATATASLVAATPDRLELTSGPVRLMLFTNVPDPPRRIPR
jgi:hypothetical protein